VDPRVKAIVEKHLAAHNGDLKKAFGDENNHPYFQTADGRKIPIHKVRIRRKITTIAVGPPECPRYVEPATNHHMEIVAELDENGNEIAWHGITVSLMEAVARLRRGQPVVQRDHGPGRRFKFSLGGNEYLEIPAPDGTLKLYRVVCISGDVVEFRLHTDARPNTVLRKMKGGRAGLLRTADSLRKAKARKVAIDLLGNVIPAND
jgi:hypothetical protein